jgi:hypothetical protein
MFSEFKNQIIERIVSQYGGRKVEKYLRQTQCPQCGKPECFTWLNSPMALVCQRSKKCGVTTLTQDLFPDLWSNLTEDHPPTKEDPKATAKAFLLRRGIDPSKLQDDVYGQLKHSNHQTLSLRVDIKVGGKIESGFHYHVLIDYRGKDNKRNQKGVALSGAVFKPEPDSIPDVSQPLYICESPLDSLALHQAGYQAVGAFGANSIPQDFYADLEPDQHIRLSFDDDSAGWDGIKKNLKFLKDKGFKNVDACLPTGPYKDWNAMIMGGSHGPMLSNEVKGKTILEGLHRGRLLTASSADACIREIANYEELTSGFRVFVFNGQTYKGVISENSGGEVQFKCNRIAGAEMEIQFREIDSDGMRTLHYTIKPPYGREEHLEVAAGNVIAGNDFSKLVMNRTETIVSNTISDQQALYEFTRNRSHIETIRSSGMFGLDPKTNWYVFGHVAFDSQGKRHLPMEGKDYFQMRRGEYIRPYLGVCAGEDQLIVGGGKTVQIADAVRNIKAAYGANGLLAMGYFLSSLYSTFLFRKYRCFPYFLCFGEKNSGKSTLARIMSKMFSFADREGIPINGSNTQKGLERTISPHSSLALTLTEWTLYRDFKEAILKDNYGRSGFQIRADRYDPKKTHTVSLNCALTFFQNTDLFRMPPVVQRMISAEILKANNTEESLEISNLLDQMPAEDLATVGERVLEERLFFEERLVDAVEYQVQELKRHGLNDQRIGRNHAIPLAGLRLLLDISDIADAREKQEIFGLAYKAALDSGVAKLNDNRQEFQHAENALNIAMEALADGAGWVDKTKDGCLAIHLPSLMKHAGDQLTSKTLVAEEFKQLGSCVSGGVIKTWLSRWDNGENEKKGGSRECYRFKLSQYDLERLEGDDSNDTDKDEAVAEAYVYESDIQIITRVFDELRAVAPNVNLDRLEKQCIKDSPDRFENKASWRAVAALTAFNQTFEVDKFGIVTLKAAPMAPDDNIEF